MSKRRILFAAALALATATGCRHRAVQPEFDVLVTDSTVTANAIPCKFEYSFVSITNASKQKSLEAIERQNILYFFGLEDFDGTAEQAANASIAQFVHDYAEGFNTAELSAVPDMNLIVDSEAQVVDSLLVYSIRRTSYTGGAHGMYSQIFHNYSLSGGYEITLSDLLETDQQAALRELIRQKLYTQFGVQGDEGLVDQGFFPENIYATENFEVTDDGITFYYNPYDIGTYALGDVEVHVTRAELEAL